MKDLQKGNKLYHYKFGAMTVADVNAKDNIVVVTFDKYHRVDADGVAELDTGKHMFEIASVGKWIFESVEEVEKQLVTVHKEGGYCVLGPLHSDTTGVMHVDCRHANPLYEGYKAIIEKEEAEKRAKKAKADLEAKKQAEAEEKERAKEEAEAKKRAEERAKQLEKEAKEKAKAEAEAKNIKTKKPQVKVTKIDDVEELITEDGEIK